MWHRLAAARICQFLFIEARSAWLRRCRLPAVALALVGHVDCWPLRAGLVSLLAIRPFADADSLACGLILADVALHTFFVGARTGQVGYDFTFATARARLVQLMSWSPKVARTIQAVRQGGTLLAPLHAHA